ncbi:hypothetical protein ACH5RR_007936 [Cinchona calisaya]|uniref:Epidermal patterning factor-like protein n=1 Tax=Cinchona calisaya TaxID=153742 RepID=A0ABD3AA56_9GENT
MLNLVWMTNSRPFVPNGKEQNSASLQINVSSGNKEENQETDENKEVSRRIGSSPPSCQHKCYGCMPCEAIQVPTTSSRVGVQYANYEPEGWKCKCGPTFYTP